MDVNVADAEGSGPSRVGTSYTEGEAGRCEAKICCLACRAAKRKCNTSTEKRAWRRCIIQGLTCEYKKHRRGRVKKADLATSTTNIADGTSPGIPSISIASTSTTGIPLITAAQENHLSRTVLTHASISNLLVGDNTRSSQNLDIQFSHVVPNGDSSPYLPNSRQPLPQSLTGTGIFLDQLLKSDCPDPIRAGVLRDSDVEDMFEYLNGYFSHLNITVATLDPTLHTPLNTRTLSPLLYTSILTVTSRITHRESYISCLTLANKLLGQAFEFGLCSLEIIQAIILLTQFKKADDVTSWRRVGYAIRMGLELRINVKAPRPLSGDERMARETLNRERTWLNLVVADYHLAIHHSLPRMISDEYIDDPTKWISEHPQISCPGESSLGPMITFSRMCRLYADLLGTVSSDSANIRLIHWLESEWKRWRRQWLYENHDYRFLRPQLSTFRLCDALFSFHIAEYKLLFTARYRETAPLDTAELTELSFAFCDCVEGALALIRVFQEEFVAMGYLEFCFNLTWVALAVVTVWLVKNMAPMQPLDRRRVIEALTQVSVSTEKASKSVDDMAGYTHRLLRHLLSGIPAEFHNTGIPHSLSREPPTSDAVYLETSFPSDMVMDWTPHTAGQIIQGQLWSTHPSPRVEAVHFPGETSHVEDILFPVDDDDFWRSLFPTTIDGTQFPLTTW